MLFLESKLLNHALDTTGRTALLKELHDREIVPLIRSHRLRCFEDVLLNHDHVNEMETALASSSALEQPAPAPAAPAMEAEMQAIASTLRARRNVIAGRGLCRRTPHTS